MALGFLVAPLGGGEVYYSLYREIKIFASICLIWIGNHSNLVWIVTIGQLLDFMHIWMFVDPPGAPGEGKKVSNLIKFSKIFFWRPRWCRIKCCSEMEGSWGALSKLWISWPWGLLLLSGEGVKFTVLYIRKSMFLLWFI